MPPLYVRPYVNFQNNHDRDAEAMAEAATRPTTLFVGIKLEEQLDLQVLHCARERLVTERMRLINQGRGSQITSIAAGLIKLVPIAVVVAFQRIGALSASELSGQAAAKVRYRFGGNPRSGLSAQPTLRAGWGLTKRSAFDTHVLSGGFCPKQLNLSLERTEACVEIAADLSCGFEIID